MQAVVAVGRGKGVGISRRWLEQFRKKLTVVFIRVVSVRWWSWSDECKTGKARESLSCEKMKEALNNRPLCIKREPVRGKAGERGRTLCREHLVSYTEDFIPRALETHWNILNEVVKSLNLLKHTPSLFHSPHLRESQALIPLIRVLLLASLLAVSNPLWLLDCSMPGLPVHHRLKLMFTEPMVPCNHLILCHTLLLLPSIFPNQDVDQAVIGSGMRRLLSLFQLRIEFLTILRLRSPIPRGCSFPLEFIRKLFASSWPAREYISFQEHLTRSWLFRKISLINHSN